MASMCTTIPFDIDLGFQRIIIEGDTLKIVHASKYDNSCWSRYGQLIEDEDI
jgi:hypothetical protein